MGPARAKWYPNRAKPTSRCTFRETVSIFIDDLAIRRVSSPGIAVVIPCYRVTRSITRVISRIGPEVSWIICVDDACPEGSGRIVREQCASDPRVSVITRERNGGVGAATCTGYAAAVKAGAEVIVKIDGDGQMDPTLIADFAAPIARGEADYVKGNRFFSIETLLEMPRARILGNAGLSFITKLSTGYWDLFDPANGYTAIHAGVIEAIPLEKVHPRFFFESDLLFRLGILRARVIELPMVGHYSNEKSNLSETRTLMTFPMLHLRNFVKRILYMYFLRGFNLASLNLVMGAVLTVFGALFGIVKWWQSLELGQVATAGTVMLAGLPVLVGLQMLLVFLAHDLAIVPTEAIHPKLHRFRILKGYRDSHGRFERS
jgi:dolichol-phosphate mannosyltransferase